MQIRGLDDELQDKVFDDKQRICEDNFDLDEIKDEMINMDKIQQGSILDSTKVDLIETRILEKDEDTVKYQDCDTESEVSKHSLGGITDDVELSIITNNDIFAIPDESFLMNNENNQLSDIEFELNNKIEEMIEKHEGLWRCKECEKTTKSRCHLKEHAEIHIKRISYACNSCNKIFLGRQNLKRHISNTHSGLFFCDACGKSGLTKSALRSHVIAKHSKFNNELNNKDSSRRTKK